MYQMFAAKRCRGEDAAIMVLLFYVVVPAASCTIHRVINDQTCIGFSRAGCLPPYYVINDHANPSQIPTKQKATMVRDPR
jgi:hypothetical protein